MSALKAPGFPPWSCVRVLPPLPGHTGGALGVLPFSAGLRASLPSQLARQLMARLIPMAF